jgi:hypothetical protein
MNIDEKRFQTFETKLDETRTAVVTLTTQWNERVRTTEDHERRIRWLERYTTKALGAVGLLGLFGIVAAVWKAFH